MGQILVAPGEWPIDRTCLPPLPDPDDDAHESAVAAREAAEYLAVQVLWGLSGRQFGVADCIVRPCLETMPGHCTPGQPRVTAYLLSWEGTHWINWWCGCTGMCRRSGPAAIHLAGPAQGVVAVTVGAATLPEDQYQLEGDVLHRVGGIWPRQDLTRPIGAPNTWSVRYQRGTPAPPGVDRLTGLLANEFLAACTGGKCRLPRNVTQVSRQGLSYSVFNPNQMYESGKTGLTEIDLWLATVNPYRLQQNPSVL